MPDTGNVKDCLEFPIFTLKNVTLQYSIVFYFVLFV